MNVNGRDIAVKYEGSTQPSIHTSKIPVGFFVGNIGNIAGLFFRSHYDISCLDKRTGVAEQNRGVSYWGYKEGNGEEGCQVENYRRVDVEILVK